MSSFTASPSPGFDCFALDPAVLKGVRAAGFTAPRAIQTETIPHILAGSDVLGLAQTGTGKTAAFVLPILSRLVGESRPSTRALVLAPTRELARQIDAEIRALARATRLKTALVYGGVAQRSQVAALRRRPEIVVACPGRLLDLIRQGVLDLGEVEVLVLDEADHMFDMGFLPDLRRILSFLPATRQNLLFSATMPKEVRRLADDVLNDPKIVDIAANAPARSVEQALFSVPETRKKELLDRILDAEDCNAAIVFTRTKHRARRLAKQLERAGYRAVSLQGNMSQSQRDRAMRGFKERRFEVLVATDIAARGIDVTGVSHVINFDVPSTPEAYTHRVGRTGRSESEGKACTFVTSSDWGWVRETERMISASIPIEEVRGVTVAKGSRQADSARGGANRRRPRGRSRSAKQRRRPTRATARRA